ncbi:MAG: DUF4184 family protein [Saprospiraceae bacterium]|nr:DUF4184 family protein [Saprospiraceae bacterium]
MPFTLAHPAIVIPLRKTGIKLSLTGLIIGSMAPDLEFLLQMREVESVGHHWYGILLFDVPIAILLSFLFHNLLRNKLLVNLPRAYRKRCIHLLDFNWNKYAMKNKGRLLLSFFIGILSHLAWDAFTHHDSLVVSQLPFLSADIHFMHYTLPVYFSLQILCSLLGMAMVHQQILSMPMISNCRETLRTDHHYWTTLILLSFITITFRLVLWPEFNSFGGIIIAIMGSILYSWILVSIFSKNNYSFKENKL